MRIIRSFIQASSGEISFPSIYRCLLSIGYHISAEMIGHGNIKMGEIQRGFSPLISLHRSIRS